MSEETSNALSLDDSKTSNALSWFSPGTSNALSRRFGEDVLDAGCIPKYKAQRQQVLNEYLLGGRVEEQRSLQHLPGRVGECSM